MAANQRRVEHLVVDTAAFVRQMQLHLGFIGERSCETQLLLLVDDLQAILDRGGQEITNTVYTSGMVLREVRSKAVLRALNVVPYELIVKEPEPETMKLVAAFSKKTGDYFSLSAVDIRVIALTYELHKQYIGADSFRDEPVTRVMALSPVKKGGGISLLPGFYEPSNAPDPHSQPESKSDKAAVPPGFYNPPSRSTPRNQSESMSDGTDPADSVTPDPDEDDEETEETKGSVDAGKEEGDKEAVGSDPERVDDTGDDGAEDEEGGYEDGGDDCGWIDKDNIHEVIKEMGCLNCDDRPTTVACLTTDFAMQNTLIQMGMNVVSLEGLLIKRANTFILRCYVCFKTTSVMTQLFCPYCGNDTLKRVGVTVDENGTKQIRINFRRPLPLRRTKKQWTTVKGGRRVARPVHSADQLSRRRCFAGKEKQMFEDVNRDFGTGKAASMLLSRDIYYHATSYGVMGQTNRFNKRYTDDVSIRRK